MKYQKERKNHMVLPSINNLAELDCAASAAESLLSLRPRGRDLSKYDLKPYASGLDVIDCSPYDFVIPRCYDGTHPDPKYAINRDAAEDAGKPWWPYAFYDFRYPAIPQVNAVWEIIKGDPGRSSLMFDVEEWQYKNVAGELITIKFPPRANLLKGMEQLYNTYVIKAGKKPKWYMNPAAIHYLKPIPSWLLACELHVADWRLNPLPDFEPWSKWCLWQWRGDPDLNYYNGTYDEFNAWLEQIPLVLTLEQRVAKLETEARARGWNV